VNDERGGEDNYSDGGGNQSEEAKESNPKNRNPGDLSQKGETAVQNDP